MFPLTEGVVEEAHQLLRACSKPRQRHAILIRTKQRLLLLDKGSCPFRYYPIPPSIDGTAKSVAMLLADPILPALTNHVALLPPVKGENKGVLEVGHVVLGGIHTAFRLTSAFLDSRQATETTIPNLLQPIIFLLEQSNTNVEALQVKCLVDDVGEGQPTV